MKPQPIILSVIAALLLILSACGEKYKVTTRINRDGSFTRIITVTGEDSAGVAKPDGLPFLVDDTWAMTFGRNPEDSTKYLVTWTRTFRSSDELNSDMKSDTSFYKNIGRELTVKKRFGFFYTYITFHETYKSLNPYTFLDYKDYITEEELQFYSGLKEPLTSEDTTRKNKVEDKVSEYLIKSVNAEIKNILKGGIKRLNNPALDTTLLADQLDSLDYTEQLIESKDAALIIDSLRNRTGNDALLLLKDLEPPLFGDFNKKLEKIGYYFDFQEYTEEVEMPGLITATNSPMLKGNQVSWYVMSPAFLLRDFEMNAESRVINYWAFILAGIVVLGLIILLAVKAFKG